MRRILRFCQNLVAVVVHAHVSLRSAHRTFKVLLEPRQPTAVRTLRLRLRQQLTRLDGVLYATAEFRDKCVVLLVYRRR